MEQWNTHMQLFHSGCLAIIAQKNPDYAPDGIPLLDLMAGCVDAGINPAQALWQLYNKHFSAVRKHFFLEKPLSSESILSRLQDGANYFAILSFYDTYKTELHAAWRAYWRSQKCEYAYTDQGGDPLKEIHHPDCQRCKSLRWLDTQAFGIGSARTSSGSTPKARG